MPRPSQGELTLIQWLRAHTPTDAKSVPVGIGDDAAVIELPSGQRLLFTTDTVLEGTHFTRQRTPYRLIGRKAVASALSDVAAMGGRAVGVAVSVALPRRLRMQSAQALHQGIVELASGYGVPVVGGDVTSWQGALAVTVSVVGVLAADEPLLRSGAKPGDAVLVTGEVGGSALGRHLTFDPRLREGEWLAERGCVHAMVDVSDGLACDLGHILEESRCGAVVEAHRVPVSADARRLAQRTGRTALEHALSDGEDFELCFTLAPTELDAVLAAWPFDTKVTVIGRMTKRGYWLEHPDGQRERLEPTGYEHAFGQNA